MGLLSQLGRTLRSAAGGAVAGGAVGGGTGYAASGGDLNAARIGAGIGVIGGAGMGLGASAMSLGRLGEGLDARALNSARRWWDNPSLAIRESEDTAATIAQELRRRARRPGEIEAAVAELQQQNPELAQKVMLKLMNDAPY